MHACIIEVPQCCTYYTYYMHTGLAIDLFCTGIEATEALLGSITLLHDINCGQLLKHIINGLQSVAIASIQNY